MVRKLKENGRPKIEITEAVSELKARKKRLEEKVRLYNGRLDLSFSYSSIKCVCVHILHILCTHVYVCVCIRVY